MAMGVVVIRAMKERGERTLIRTSGVLTGARGQLQADRKYFSSEGETGQNRGGSDGVSSRSGCGEKARIWGTHCNGGDSGC